MKDKTQPTIPDALNNLDQSKLFNDIKETGKLELKQPVSINICTADKDFVKCIKKNKIKLEELRDKKVVAGIIQNLIKDKQAEYKQGNLRLCVTDDFKKCQNNNNKNEITEKFVNYNDNKDKIRLLLKGILFTCLFIILYHKTTHTKIIKLCTLKKNSYIYIGTLIFFVIYFIINIIV